MVGALEELGALRGSEPYTHAVPFSHRSGERIEPLISLQWFMRMDELARPAIEAVRDGRVRFHPEGQAARLPRLDGEHPAVVHLAPALVGSPAAGLVLRRLRGDLRRAHAARALRRVRRTAAQDEDVLDTWFSSALWPFATLGWPEQTAALRAFYPTDVLSPRATSSSCGSRG